jgi:hypothetical protein
MTIDRRPSPLVVLCFSLVTALGTTPLSFAGDELVNGVGGGTTAHGNDGVGGIERVRGPIGPPGKFGGPPSPGLVIPIPPTPPNTSSNSTSYGAWSNLGFGLPGSTTSPSIEVVLCSQAESSISLLMTDGLPENAVYLVAGLERQPTPFEGGILVPSPDVLLTGLTLDARGELLLPLTALELLPPLMLIYIQAWMPDNSNVLGFSSTNAISLLVP